MYEPRVTLHQLSCGLGWYQELNVVIIDFIF